MIKNSKRFIITMLIILLTLIVISTLVILSNVKDPNLTKIGKRVDAVNDTSINNIVDSSIISDIVNNSINSSKVQIIESENKEEGHVHKFSDEWTIEVEPTCLSVGTAVKECECGAKQVKEIKDPYAHKKEPLPDEAATCTMFGKIKHSVCVYCNQEFFDITKKLGHSYSNEITIDKQATCTEDGLTSRHCTREGCNESTDKTVIKATGHNYVQTKIIPATCTTDEVIVSTCTKCNDVKEESTSNKALGHNFGNYVQNNDGSCTETATCTRCGATDTRIVPAHVHTFPNGWKTVVEPTCLSVGIAERQCECGEKQTKEIRDPNAHKKIPQPDIPATSTTYGRTNRSICEYCHQEFFTFVKQ